MKKVILVTFVMLIFCIYANAQTKKSNEDQRLKDIETEILTLENQAKIAKADLYQLRVKYTDTYPAVQKAQSEVTFFEEKLFALNLEKKDLLHKEFVRMLPNNDLLLLKMIVIQNKKIIELLEKMVNR